MIKILSVLVLSCLLSIGDPDDQFLTGSAQAVMKYSNFENQDPQYIQALEKLGYYKKYTNDSYLDLRTAVLRFQSDCNLVADGIPGPQFDKVLSQRLINNQHFRQDIIKNAPSQGYWITINKTKRILTLYYSNRVVKKYPVAVGRKEYDTPQGKFRIVNKVTNPKWSGGGYAEPVIGGDKNNPLGFRWLGLSIGNKHKYGIHGNNNPYSIGKHISRGCIRMLNEDVEQVFDIVPGNTRVWIGANETLQKWGIYQKSL